MSVSAAIQKLIVARLRAAAPVAALVGGRIYDHRPAASGFPSVTIGPSDAVREEAECLRLRTETVQVDCWTRTGDATRAARELADAVTDALHHADGELETGALVQMRVPSIRAFRDRDGVTGHGVVTVEVEVEE